MTMETAAVDAFGMPSLSVIAETIKAADSDIATRMKCLFQARHHGGPAAAEALMGGLGHNSVLLRHEICYVLGQLGERCAAETLIRLLQDESEDCMVRHEAAEALAALGDDDLIPVVEQYVDDASEAVRDTCRLALHSLEDQKAHKDDGEAQANDEENPYKSVDPTKPKKNYTSVDLPSLRATLLNQANPLWDRYEALFALRNIKTPAAHSAIVASLQQDVVSALFRHEVAFVLGQIRDGEACDALVQCLADDAEHPMARHEAALALGSVAVETEDAELRRKAVQSLVSFRSHATPVVAESCVVGLDTIKESTGIVPESLLLAA